MKRIEMSLLVAACLLCTFPLAAGEFDDAGSLDYDGLRNVSESLEPPALDWSNLELAGFDADKTFAHLQNLAIEVDGKKTVVTKQHVMALLAALESGNTQVTIDGMVVSTAAEIKRQAQWWKAATDRCLMVGVEGTAPTVSANKFSETADYGVDSKLFDSMFSAALDEQQQSTSGYGTGAFSYEHVQLVAAAYETLDDRYLHELYVQDLSTSADPSVAYGIRAYQGNRETVSKVQVAALRKFFPKE